MFKQKNIRNEKPNETDEKTFTQDASKTNRTLQVDGIRWTGIQYQPFGFSSFTRGSRFRWKMCDVCTTCLKCSRNAVWCVSCRNRRQWCTCVAVAAAARSHIHLLTALCTAYNSIQSTIGFSHFRFSVGWNMPQQIIARYHLRNKRDLYVQCDSVCYCALTMKPWNNCENFIFVFLWPQNERSTHKWMRKL